MSACFEVVVHVHSLNIVFSKVYRDSEVYAILPSLPSPRPHRRPGPGTRRLHDQLRQARCEHCEGKEHVSRPRCRCSVDDWPGLIAHQGVPPRGAHAQCDGVQAAQREHSKFELTTTTLAIYTDRCCVPRISTQRFHRKSVPCTFRVLLVA